MNKHSRHLSPVVFRFAVLVAITLFFAACGEDLQSPADAGSGADVTLADAGEEASTTLMGPCASEDRNTPAPDCSGEELCLVFGAAPMCTLICETAEDCPSGFVCQAAWIDDSLQCISPPCGEGGICDEGLECRDHGCFGELCVAETLPAVSCGF